MKSILSFCYRLSDAGATRNFLQPREDAQPTRACAHNHLVSALRCAADTQNGIAAREKALSDRVEDFIEGGIADVRRSRQSDQRQGKPLADDWQMTSAEKRKRIILHGAHVGCQLGRNIASTRAIW